MSIINLADAKVTYEGETLPAINLISKLQLQLQETASRMAAMAATLGQLQTALLSSHTVEVKLTLSKEDYGKFRALMGADDSERVRKAIMDVIRAESAEASPVVAETRPVETEVTGPVLSLHAGTPQVQAVEHIIQEPKGVTDLASKKKTSATKCPRCQSPIDLPDVSGDQWPVEVKCGNCGAKCLIKSKAPSAVKTDKAGFEPLDEAAYGKLFDMLSS